MDHRNQLSAKLKDFAIELATGNQRIHDLFSDQDVEIANAYEAACIARTDEESKEAWEHLAELQQQHDKKMEVIARWLSEHNERVIDSYFKSLES